MAPQTAVVVPPPATSETKAADVTTDKAVLAGGCFWGVQGVFQHVKGVKNAVSGYAGGAGEFAQYEMVGTGKTGHAEAVEITFDPKVVGYGTLLQVYFSVVHNPTELNRQGPDTGPQYRSTIFAESDAQRQLAEAYIKQLDKASVYDAPIVTTIETSKKFYPAEAYHQDYATRQSPQQIYRHLRPAEDRQSKKAFPESLSARSEARRPHRHYQLTPAGRGGSQMTDMLQEEVGPSNSTAEGRKGAGCLPTAPLDPIDLLDLGSCLAFPTFVGTADLQRPPEALCRQ